MASRPSTRRSLADHIPYYRSPIHLERRAGASLLADILPTAYEVGVLNGSVRPGDVVAIVGADQSG